ncbi:MAG: hypothetical protein FWG50_02840 [Kiritimatiellaeota bacterium]|nr:hypothetical protein [Kiritimatiellota bacterium]
MNTMRWLGVLGFAVCAASAEEVRQDGPLIEVEVRFLEVTGSKGLKGVDVLSTNKLPKHVNSVSIQRVVTKSGRQGSSKIATEYIYPKDFRLWFFSGSDRPEGHPAVVEPQNFTLQEVGVFVDATPTWNPEDNTIDLDITPSVVKEPTWHGHNYVDEQGKRLTTDDGKFLELPMERPYFPTVKFSTKLKLKDGIHTVVGGVQEDYYYSESEKVSTKVPDEKKRAFYFVIKASVVKPPEHPEG